MNDLENATPAPAELSELQAQTESLRHLIGSVLILVIVLSGALNIFLLRQCTDLRGACAQMTAVVDQYQKNDGPGIENFLRRISEYGQSHPDFAPLLQKYGMRTQATTAVAPVGIAPAPAATSTNTKK